MPLGEVHYAGLVDFLRYARFVERVQRLGIAFLGLALAACGSILGVAELTTDQQEPATVAVREAGPKVVVDPAPQKVDSSQFLDAAPDAQCSSVKATPAAFTQDGAGNGWDALGNLSDEDGNDAVGHGCCGSDGTKTVTATNFNFNVPEKAQIQGATIRLKGHSNVGGLFRDSTVKLTSLGTLGTELKVDANPAWGGDYESRLYGNPGNADGLALFPAAVNSADFGVVFAAAKPPYSNINANFEVDVVEVTIFYCQ